MSEHFHTIIIGGGCLGVSVAVALARRLGTSQRICIVEKAMPGAGLSSRHSGIVQAANPSNPASPLSRTAVESWKQLEAYWDISIPYRETGALWIIPAQSATDVGWKTVTGSFSAADIDFHAVGVDEAVDIAGTHLRLDEDEACFFEPGALCLETGQIVPAMHKAIRQCGAVLKEGTEVLGFETNSNRRITAVKTSGGNLSAEFVVNAAGGWSPSLFASLGIFIPVALVPAYIADWMVSASELPESLPIIADYAERTYFRCWPGSQIRMHQPRDRRASSIARVFSKESLVAAPPDIILEPSNFLTHHGLLEPFRKRLQHRFPGVKQPIFTGGFVSYFDVTPDLNFILGPDDEIENLTHCLGGGLGFKFGPLFGALMSDMILDGRIPEEVKEYSIRRFKNRPLDDFRGVSVGAIEST
jgi:sarcosine oxidase subunit beta